VYRNPGLHFGDIHVLKATYVKALESFIGNAKFAIFFPCKGPRSLGDEIAGGDFDGDMYWVSRNPQVGMANTVTLVSDHFFYLFAIFSIYSITVSMVAFLIFQYFALYIRIRIYLFL
jgi:hypothetical protein